MALVELGQGRGRAKVVRELGDPRVASDVIDAMLEDRQVRRGFSRRIEEAAVAIGEADGLPVERRDLRDLPTFTVDPASAHDFDDAVSASRTKRGVRLWIHIADVAAHIRPGGALEKEAHRRANSTYVPGRVAPMLPHALERGVQPRSGGRPARRHRRDRALRVGRAALGKLLPQSDPLGRPAELRPARRDLRGQGEDPGAGCRAAGPGARRRPRSPPGARAHRSRSRASSRSSASRAAR